MLTNREQEIVGLVAVGLTNVEIADRLCISHRTVETHIENVKRKLGMTRRAHVMAWAVREAAVV